MFISYAQNFEDVMLWRALKHVSQGCYIDIGAQDPVVDSVSLAFHERGWLGIHVEPCAHYADLLRQYREGDLVIQAAVGDEPGISPFFEIPGSGISTLDPSIAQLHCQRGFTVESKTTPVITLSSVLSQAAREVHWLKIDVEGFERQVLSGWGDSPVRPWIVVVESTAPLTSTETHGEWEELLLGKGYAFAYLDGLNRYYVSESHADLLDRFAAPPNVFDDFAINGTGSSSYHRALKDRIESQARVFEDRITAERESSRTELAAERVRIRENESAWAQLREALTQEIAEAQRELSVARLDTEACREESGRREARLHSLEEQFAAARQAHAERDELLHSALRERATREEEIASQLLEVQREFARLATQSWQSIETVKNGHAESERRFASLAQALERSMAEQLAAAQATAARTATALRLTQAELDRLRRSWRWRLLHPFGIETGSSGNSRWPDLPAVGTEVATMAHVPQLPGSPNNTNPSPATPADPRSNMMSSAGQSTASEPDLDALLAWHGSDFLQKAYQAILKRDPDESGLAFYLRELKSGVSKVVILYRLIHSVEARSRGLRYPTLNREIQRRLPKWRAFARKARSLVRSGRSDEMQALQDLLALDGKDFIESAYRTLLLRDPDESGMRHHLDLLMSGHPKVSILARMFDSPERRELDTAVPGLERAILAHRARRLPLLGALFSRGRVEGYSASEFLLRRMDQRLDMAFQAISANTTECKKSTAHITRLVDDLAVGLKMPSAPAGVQRKTEGISGGGVRQGALQSTDSRNFRLATPSADRMFAASIIYFYVDHTVRCPINTGMQRVVRRLGRSLLESGQRTVFVKWDPDQKAIVLASQEDLAHLAKWHGPQLTVSDLAAYPKATSEMVRVPEANLPGGWLLVPEVTHITYHPEPVTLDIMLAARRMQLGTAYIYYDAIPLRLREYADTGSKHELYMQQLLLADVVIPISRRSGAELERFYHGYQESTEARPHICPLQLPAESQLSLRQTNCSEPTEPVILCVGSIEPRKNQLRLLEAFDEFCREHPDTRWKLVLAGNLRGDVAAAVGAFISRNPRISHAQNISDPELDALYRACSFTVFPSLEEGFGLPILESLWYAKPCICADYGAMAEVADGGGCYGVDTSSVSALKGALTQVALDPHLRHRLAQEAANRPLATWDEYSDEVLALLSKQNNPMRRVGRIYYWVDNTAINSSNSGIQRVTRQLAKALIAMGADVVPVRWNSSLKKLAPATSSELEHLACWDGPNPRSWSAWSDPSGEQGAWLLLPELTHGELPYVKRHAADLGLRCGAVFYDAIPYKLRNEYGNEFGENHRQYMVSLFEFDKVFPISAFSRLDLLSFYLLANFRSTGLDHRIRAIPLPDEFSSSPRVLHSKTNDGNVIDVLSVVSAEPRKNVLTLLKAFERAQQKTTRPLHLTIVGRRIAAFEPLAKEMEAQIARIGSVNWEQDVDDARLSELYARSDFTVFPSLEEGFGLPILESLWNGRPCICDNQGAMLEVASGGGCVAVNMRDVDAVSGAIVDLAGSKDKRAALALAATQRHVRTWADYAASIVRELAFDVDAPKRPVATISEQLRVLAELPNLTPRPLLSVCISTYNRAGWLSVALRNLARMLPSAQPDIEIVVCDNCSSDSTPEVVKPYLSRVDFRYFRNPHNVGMLGNLRVTAHHARGKYIWILGDDDLPFTESIERVLQAIRNHPPAALIYLNYAYTRETDAAAVTDLDGFLASGTPVTQPSSDRVALVKDIAAVNENLFTAIYCLVFRRDHALRAYSQDTSGRPFSTMRTSIPTTYHVLNHMMEETAVWLGTPQLLVNFNVSWNAYASLQILERVPEALDLAEMKGADPKGIDKLRENLIPGYVHYFNEIYGEDKMGNHLHFSITRVVSRIRHLSLFPTVAPDLAAIYRRAYSAGHPAANVDPALIFGRSLNSNDSEKVE
ncbi:MAG TPA: FkbM family methyltransferase [Albitalea sp.]|uniref:FkbM family methyltransferase n=1 Tax=Piscinibacter sp. TaxID=1903157 RepID=UPI002ED1C29A